MTTLFILGFAGIGGWEVFLILAAFLILFGAKKIPDLAKGLGKGIREFKDAASGIKEEMNRASTDIDKV